MTTINPVFPTSGLAGGVLTAFTNGNSPLRIPADIVELWMNANGGSI